MSNSPLISYTKLSPHCNSPRNHAIDTVTIHCVCGQLTAQSLGDLFANPARNASSNYGIGTDGQIALYAPESDRSWCSSNPANDHRSITIECASDKDKPYAINDKVYESLIRLLVDIVQRNPGFKGSLRWKADKNLIGQPDKQNMTVHRWFANTSCPGDYIYERLGQIADEVNKRLLVPIPKKYAVNDIVYFKGGKDYNSQSAKSGNTKIASLAKITKIGNGNHPYHCRRVDEKLNFKSGGVYGWVDADTLTT